MRAIILALGDERKEDHERKDDDKDTTSKKKESFSSSSKSEVDLVLVFKPLLQYAIESVQKCSSLVTSCVVLVEREDAQFAKELCEKMTTTYASSSSLPSSSSNKSTTLTTTKEEEKFQAQKY